MILDGSRECTGCHETRPIADFSPLSSGPGGRNRRCRACVREYFIAYRARQREGLPETLFRGAQVSRDAGELTRICASCERVLPMEDFRQRPNRNDFTLRCISCRSMPKTPARAWLWTTYRLRESDYESMHAAQEGVCAICQEAPKGPLVVDHDHSCCPGKKTCGKCVRGLLCDNCNRSLSVVEKFRDRTLAYLDKGTIGGEM